MAFTELPLEKAFMLFEPGPVILVATNDGIKNNLMTITWHMVTDFCAEPRADHWTLELLV